jgi:cytochrome c556
VLKRKILAAGFWLALLAVPAAARAGEVSHVMHSWRQAQRAVDAMLHGAAPYDQAQLRQAMAAYVADASGLARRMNTGTPDGRDLQRRFLDFAAMAQQSAADISRPQVFRTDFSQVKAQCDSCHAIYN